jgi:hypothetical protein
MVPSRDTPGGRAYLDLKKKARAEGRPTDELLALYALEGFLGRLAASEHIDNLVLKGGVLLAAYDTRRPTNDIDFQAQALAITQPRFCASCARSAPLIVMTA